jgi:serine/threonine protein kinase
MSRTRLLDRVKASLQDRYLVERENRCAGVTITFDAQDTKLKKRVWLTVVHPDVWPMVGSQRFLRQIEIHGLLTHPLIVPLIDSGEKNGLLYYVMPHLEGEWLEERLRRERPLPLEFILRTGRDVATALSYAHSQGVIHRDIKPGTIFLQGDRALLSEFSLAQVVRDAEHDRITAAGMIVGTPSYMSPEQAAGETVDERSDVYNLGCVLYEMLAGEPPFIGPTVQSIMARMMSRDPPSLKAIRPKIPRDVRRAIERALARLPADRYQTATTFLEALAGLLDAMSHGTPSPTIPAPHSDGLRDRGAACELLRSALKHRYEVIREIGRGGMATVILAVDLQLNRRVAVKLLRSELIETRDVQRFLREIAFTAQLNHPHILQPIEAGEADGIPYFVMPYIEGGSLRDWMTRGVAMTVGNVITVGKIVADALHFAHANGVIHRDIKPENILMHQGFPMVADFGIARSLRVDRGGGLTKPGYTQGSPPYWSPEQASGDTSLDPRTDVYSLACVLVELLTGTAPPLGVGSALSLQDASEPADPRRAALEAVLRRALAMPREERHASAAEFRDELAAVKGVRD